MVIAFYPGAGGNRYLRMLQGLEWQQSRQSYDLYVKGQLFKTRYLLDDIEYPTQDYVLTHCMNETHIKKKIPGHKICFIVGNLKQCLQREWELHGHDRYVKNLTIHKNRLEHYNAFKDATWPICNSVEEIDNLPTSILEEIIQDYNNVSSNIVSNTCVLTALTQNFINKVNSAYDTINWHKEYYTRYPIECMSDANVININTDDDVFSATIRQELMQYKSDVFDEVWNALNV
jgi:hypothetical protein